MNQLPVGGVDGTFVVGIRDGMLVVGISDGTLVVGLDKCLLNEKLYSFLPMSS